MLRLSALQREGMRRVRSMCDCGCMVGGWRYFGQAQGNSIQGRCPSPTCDMSTVQEQLYLSFPLFLS